MPMTDQSTLAPNNSPRSSMLDNNRFTKANPKLSLRGSKFGRGQIALSRIGPHNPNGRTLA